MEVSPRVRKMAGEANKRLNEWSTGGGGCVYLTCESHRKRFICANPKAINSAERNEGKIKHFRIVYTRAVSRSPIEMSGRRGRRATRSLTRHLRAILTLFALRSRLFRRVYRLILDAIIRVYISNQNQELIILPARTGVKGFVNTCNPCSASPINSTTRHKYPVADRLKKSYRANGKN